MIRNATHLAEIHRLDAAYKLVIAEKERQIVRLERDKELLQARLDRKELESAPRPHIVPKTEQSKKMVQEGERNWLSYLNNHMSTIEAAEALAKEKANGMGEQERAVVHESVGSDAARSDSRGGESANQQHERQPD